jgi:NADPH2 dehydrogenase
LIQQLRVLGIDAIVSSSGGAVDREILPHKNLPLECTRKLKQRSRMIVIADGDVVTSEQATSVIQDNIADLVYISKPLLKCPNWVLHAAEEVEDTVFWAPTHHGALQLQSRGCGGN